MGVLTKQFTLPEVLGVMHGYLLEDGGFERLHEMMEWLVNEQIFTHQIPSIVNYLQAGLAKQFPMLNSHKVLKEVKKMVKSIKTSNKLNETCRWNKLYSLYGNVFNVQPIQVFDSYNEPKLVDLINPEKIILIVKQDDDFPEYL